jgi:hypothetical protein
LTDDQSSTKTTVGGGGAKIVAIAGKPDCEHTSFEKHDACHLIADEPAGLHSVLSHGIDEIDDHAGLMHCAVNLVFDMATSLAAARAHDGTIIFRQAQDTDSLLYVAGDLREQSYAIEAIAEELAGDLKPLQSTPPAAPVETAEDPQRAHFNTILERGHDIQSAARLLLQLSRSDTADNMEVPMPLRELFVQTGYLARQIEAHAASITEIANPASLGIVEAPQ